MYMHIWSIAIDLIGFNSLQLIRDCGGFDVAQPTEPMTSLNLSSMLSPGTCCPREQGNNSPG
jgi:hypothetical protein